MRFALELRNADDEYISMKVVDSADEALKVEQEYDSSDSNVVVSLFDPYLEGSGKKWICTDHLKRTRELYRGNRRPNPYCWSADKIHWKSLYHAIEDAFPDEEEEEALSLYVWSDDSSGVLLAAIAPSADSAKDLIRAKVDWPTLTEGLLREIPEVYDLDSPRAIAAFFPCPP